jgi:hypothetical protein
VGAQYVKPSDETSYGNDIDRSYSANTKYIGYFDSESCYLYDKALRYFYRERAAISRTCGGTAFSGNFMNWATSSAIDVLRLGLTGGDRVIDTSSITVLQRAVLPGTTDNTENNFDKFWNETNFPSKQINRATAEAAVPTSLLPSGGTGRLFVANCLNQIYFGTLKAGTCASPGNNGNLGITPRAVGTPSAVGPLPAEDLPQCLAHEPLPGGTEAIGNLPELDHEVAGLELPEALHEGVDLVVLRARLLAACGLAAEDLLFGDEREAVLEESEAPPDLALHESIHRVSACHVRVDIVPHRNLIVGERKGQS